MRPVATIALLAGNGVLLFLGVSDLLFVVSDWTGGFAARSEAVFGNFAGPVAVALPLLAVLIATHVAPVLPQSRAILLTAFGQYLLSGLFGVITYLGAFANGVFEVRATFDGLLGRAVWLAFLTIAATAVYRVYRAMYPPPPPAAAYRYPPTVYGQPYPGQPSYPRPTHYRSGASGAVPVDPAETAEVPPIPAPGAPTTVVPTQAGPAAAVPEPPAEPTRLIAPPGTAPGGSAPGQ
jgi:hypothetical protein